MISDHNRMKSEINKTICDCTPDIWQLNNTIPNNTWIKEEIKISIENRTLNDKFKSTYYMSVVQQNQLL